MGSKFEHVFYPSVSYIFRLKKDSAKLHKKFISICYSRLGSIISIPEENQEALNEGCELEVNTHAEQKFDDYIACTNCVC